jgi:major membrane immunogen (membrane-anchored lipoprotein)
MKIKFLTFFCLAAVLFLAACGKSDADLQKAVTDKLKADNVAGVTAAVKDGVATLTGEVADITVKNKAEASAKAVEGIKSVVNSLTLKPLPTPVPAPADPMLKGKVDEALKKAGCTGVTIESKDGKITASGTAPDAKYAECVQAIMQSGATGFDNKIVKGK